MSTNLQYLLLQVRNENDPMAEHEHRCFARVLGCDLDKITVRDFIHSLPSDKAIQACDMLLFGGSGDYSVAAGGDWLPDALEMMRHIADLEKPTYASCWGFQAIAKALGGEVQTIMEQAEVGTYQLFRTEAGAKDPVFSKLNDTFYAQMGHQDIVTKLPDNAVLLASTEKVANQAFKIIDKPIYCTQFHPELEHEDLLMRLRAYPKYVKEITGLSFDEFVKTTRETPELSSMVGNIRDTLFS